jgi:hypothetical protein
MPRSGALKLKDYPTDIVRLACSRCPRKGQYRKAALMARVGKDITLADLRHEIAAKCERQGTLGTACGVYYVDLRPKC